ncbi:AHH domain-containing protein [Myxococcus sp. K15C18031901]|nr:AHH domain-containing protein [Myxococcus dinghuensis]
MVSDANGGPWTPLFQDIFNRARMSLSDNANLIRLRGHQGPHPQKYHEEVLTRIDGATRGCRGVERCRAALVNELAKIARELTKQGSKLRKLLMNGAEE